MSDYHSCRRCMGLKSTRAGIAHDVRQIVKKLSKNPPPSEQETLKGKLAQLRMRAILNNKTIKDHLDEVEYAS